MFKGVTMRNYLYIPLSSGQLMVASIALSLLSACGGGDGSTGATGKNGITAAVSTSAEPAGANCASGGSKVQAGADTNSNGTLEANEVTTTNYVCNGAAGTAGATGTPGTAGTNGLNSIILLSPELAGSNCAIGGTKIQAGLDLNNDRILQPAEITSTTYLCSAP
jgi:hypothetical protein